MLVFFGYARACVFNTDFENFLKIDFLICAIKRLGLGLNTDFFETDSNQNTAFDSEFKGIRL